MDPRRKSDETTVRTVSDIETLKRSRSRLRKMEKVLDEVIATDTCFTEACAKRGISWRMFHNLLKSKSFLGCEGGNGIEMEEAEKALAGSDACARLYEDVFADGNVKMPEDPAESILYVTRSLNDRERTVVLEKYGINTTEDGKTFTALGEELGISRERVRQILRSAIAKLRTGKNAEILKIGLSEYEKACREAKEASDPSGLTAIRVREEAKRKKSRMTKTEKELDEIPIEVLHLSSRPMNCLKRSGIKTMYDLLSKTDDRIMGIRRLGKKAFVEIKNEEETFCHENGIDPEELRSYGGMV